MENLCRESASRGVKTNLGLFACRRAADLAGDQMRAVIQVSAGSQSFNGVNPLRILGRGIRMIPISNQSSVAKARQEFNEAGACSR